MPSLPDGVVTVIQARTGSSRLPNKVMRPILDQPLLVRLVERVRAADLTGTVVIATTTTPEDDAIADLCRKEGFHCFRGHPTDLLDRHYRAGLTYEARTVVKIPSDCPLIDPKIIDRVLAHYLADPTASDFVSNLHPPTYPDGNDVEVMSMAALTTAWQEATRDFEREHTTPYFWENPHHFRLGNVAWETGLDYSMTHRWVVDYAKDYDFVKAVYGALYPHKTVFELEDILALLDRKPEIAALNRQYVGVNWYRHHLDELRTVTPNQTRAIG